jgi:hypothetical protein
MEPIEVLRRAYELVQQAELPATLHPIAFSRAVDLVASSGPTSKAGRGGDDAAGGGATGGPYDQIATRVGISRDAVERVWFVAPDGSVELLVPKAALPASAAATQRLFALLVVAARQGAALEPDGWTDVQHVRAELTRYGRLDRGHFAEHLDKLTDVMSVRGPKSAKQLRMLPDGWRAAAAEATRVIEN